MTFCVVPADSFPTAGNLQEAGMFVRYTGDDLPLFWYKDDTGRPFVSLWALADVAGWQYQPNTGLESRLNERSVMIAFDGNGISLLSVDGFPLAHTALVWQDNLYVTADFLAALGLQAHVDGDVFVIQYP